MRGTSRRTERRPIHRATVTAVAALVALSGTAILAPTALAGPCPAGADVDLGGHGEDYPFHICVDIESNIVPAFKVAFRCEGGAWLTHCVPPPEPDQPQAPNDPGAPPQPGTPPSPGTYTLPPDPGTPNNDNCLIGNDTCHPSAAELQRWATATVAAYDAWRTTTTGTAANDVNKFFGYANQEADRYECWALCQQPDYPGYVNDHKDAYTAWLVNLVNSVDLADDTVDTVKLGEHHVTPNVEEWLLNEACEAIKGEDADPEDCERDIQDILDQLEEIVNDVLSNLPDELVIGAASSPSDGTTGLLVQANGQAYYVPLAPAP